MDLTMSGAYGRAIYASASGTVISSGWSGGYGYCVKIRHSNGAVTLYAHCSSLLVSAGETVTQGQQIARIGSTGNSTGPHLRGLTKFSGTGRMSTAASSRNMNGTSTCLSPKQEHWTR
jgi:murein DD-endopeptidase MepM/ murein hydrolase activator NlpD